MTWLTGRVERQLITALLTVALMVSCGIASRAKESPDPTAAVSEPTATAREPTTEPTVLPTSTPQGDPVTGAQPVATPAPTAPPSAPATATRAPSTSPLATHRLVTYYGHPGSDKMGILGELDPEAMIAKLKEQAAAYTAADPSRPALCTIELIASVAQGSAGNDGFWLIRTPAEVIERYAQLAEKHGCLLLLDIQMGYDTVANDIKAIMPYLERPYVHLAIDPEFHVAKGQVPGEHYGSITAADVNHAGQVLGELVRHHRLPDKVLVIHQFRDDMLPDKAKITPMPNVDLVVMMDGWGGLGAKTTNYQYFVGEQLIQFGGLKLFYRQDDPVMTPQQVLELVPTPLVVCYQ